MSKRLYQRHDHIRYQHDSIKGEVKLRFTKAKRGSDDGALTKNDLLGST